MTHDEIKLLLDKQSEKAEEALALMKRRPHYNKMFTETLRSAAVELVNAVYFLKSNLGQPLFDEEGVKAYIGPRYDEFLRCRSRVLADFYEIDQQEQVK